jgi:hypothetical protein
MPNGIHDSCCDPHNSDFANSLDPSGVYEGIWILEKFNLDGRHVGINWNEILAEIRIDEPTKAPVHMGGFE